MIVTKHRNNLLFVLAAAIMLALVSGVTQAAQESLGAPNRVVLVHGLARNSMSMWALEMRLENAGFDVVSLDYSSLNRSVAEVQQQVRDQLYACCNDSVPTHYVGYSLGGLLIRGFFAEPANQAFAIHRQQVVMIGTPNNGTQIVDTFAAKQWFQLLGDTTLALGTQTHSFPMGLPMPDFSAGIIAGTNSWSIADDILAEASDGLVPVQSTKLPNMADFIAVYANHSMLRYNGTVAKQTIHFLQHGRFDHQTSLPSCAGTDTCLAEQI